MGLAALRAGVSAEEEGTISEWPDSGVRRLAQYCPDMGLSKARNPVSLTLGPVPPLG